MMHKRKSKAVNIDDKDIKNNSWANASFISIKRGEVILETPGSHVGYQCIGRLWRFEGDRDRCISGGLSFMYLGKRSTGSQLGVGHLCPALGGYEFMNPKFTSFANCPQGESWLQLSSHPGFFL